MRAFLASCVLTLLLVGCSTIQNLHRNDRAVDQNTHAAEQALHALRSGTTAVDETLVNVITDRAYIAPAPKLLDQEQTIPVSCDITFAPADSVGLLEFGQKVTRSCGMQVRITPDALAALAQRRPQANQDQSPGASPIPLPPGVNLPAPIGGGSGRWAPPTFATNRISIRYTGPVQGLLDAVTARLGLSWRYDDHVISIFYLDTRVFKVFSIPTVTQMNSVVSSGSSAAAGISGGGSSGGGASAGSSGGGISGTSSSAQTTTVSLHTNATDDLANAITSMLTPDVGRLALSPSSGSVVVTDTPEVLDQIGTYITSLNTFATKQVLLNVKVLTVQINDSDEFGINWNLVYQSLANEYGVGIVSAFGAAVGAVTGSVNILEGSSRFSGSQLLVSALSKQGRVSVLIQPSVTTLNLEPVPVQIAKQTSYLAQSTTTLTADVGSTTSLTPGTVTTGFNMNLLPYILPDNETILLQYAINLSSLNSIRRVESGDSAIEIPEVDNRIMSQKVRIRSGETLVLSGFEQSTKGTDRSGVGSPWNWLFGGGIGSSTAREVLVVLITPVVTS